MELILTIGLGVLTLLGAAFAKQTADEFKAWTPWIVERLIRRAVSKLPMDRRERLDEEWRSHIEETPGEIGKIFVALSFSRASHNLSEVFIVDRAIGAAILFIIFPVIVVAYLAMFFITRGNPIGIVTVPDKSRCKIIKVYVFYQSDSAVYRYIRRISVNELLLLINIIKGEVQILPEIKADIRKLLRKIRDLS